jgi:phenylalanyl-tRNA synthetase beta subunit
VLLRAGQVPQDSYRLTNSISPDLQYYRQTLTPSLLGAVHGNVKQGFDAFALFEVNKAHPKQHGMTSENVPAEVDMVALTLTNKKPPSGAPFYQAKKMLHYLGDALELDLLFSPIDTDPNYPVSAPFEHRRSAVVTDRKTDTFLGIVGEYKKSVAKSFKLPEYSAGFEISARALLTAVQKRTNSYTPASRYPGTERDVCFRVAADVPFQQIIDSIELSLAETTLETVVSPLDIYQQADAPTKNITVRIKLTAHDRTLTGDEVAEVMQGVTASVVSAAHATVV